MKMGCSNTDFQVKKEAKLCNCNRRVSRERSMENPSFRYYSLTAGAVPFHWEVQPGTPKYPYSDETPILPPLTPPPSYLKLTLKPVRSANLEKPTGIINSILPMLKLKKKKKMELKYPLPPKLTSSQSNSSSSISTSTCGKSRLSWESSASSTLTLSSGATATPEEESNEVKESPTRSSFFHMCFDLI
ncbi:hypothetical protein ZOSMA_170G00200 [Zostera marina]|uniref:Uncharacterized protein n=1 Tax=Zostera marina TaxID=29655 RepID=A0A0K9PSQ8_ZOSMR|nr:hypothetical protein ZOSMA_170G00200 [Zostera marina]